MAWPQNQFDEALRLLTDEFIAGLAGQPVEQIQEAIQNELDEHHAGVLVVNADLSEAEDSRELALTLAISSSARCDIDLTLPA